MSLHALGRLAQLTHIQPKRYAFGAHIFFSICLTTELARADAPSAQGTLQAYQQKEC